MRQQLDTTFPTANAAVIVMEDLGIVMEMTGLKKNRSYSYRAYVELLSRTRKLAVAGAIAMPPRRRR